MEREIMKKIMSGKLTLADWKKYKESYEAYLWSSNLSDMKKNSENFNRIANLVIDKLTEEEIATDTCLTLVYLERTHPEMFKIY